MPNRGTNAFEKFEVRTEGQPEGAYGPEDVGDEPVSFAAAETRADDMRDVVEGWLRDLSDLVDEARASEAFREWLDVQRRFHDYSYRNTLLIQCQRPTATRVAGYRTWQEEFGRQVEEGEEAIWIWAPIVANRCPSCGNSRRYHDDSDCSYDETPPGDWSKGVVAFKPVPVFDVSQTEGEPLPELDTAPVGDGEDLLEALCVVADELGIDARIVPTDGWSHGEADGVCDFRGGPSARPRVEVRDRPNEAAVAGTLVHEFAHAALHAAAEDPGERANREVEAEAVAYLVGRYFGLDASKSAFYLAAWQGEESSVIGERLGRISRTAKRIIDAVDA